MTEFERAQVRLRAWEALAGWGAKKADEKFAEPWNWDERLKFAERLADWSCEVVPGSVGNAGSGS